VSYDSIELRKPSLLVGIGKIGRNVVSKLSNGEHDLVLISNNQDELVDFNSVHIDCDNWINP